MSEAIASVIVASAQSVAKVFVIGSIGYGAVKCELKRMLLLLFRRDATFLISYRSLLHLTPKFLEMLLFFLILWSEL
jgi:hypothetical protein